jgi:hypothetical protein
MEFEAGDEKASMTARGLSFEAIFAAPILAIEPNLNRPGQIFLIVQIGSYAITAPCKPLGKDRWLIVTAYPSRKHTNKYLP